MAFCIGVAFRGRNWGRGLTRCTVVSVAVSPTVCAVVVAFRVLRVCWVWCCTDPSQLLQPGRTVGIPHLDTGRWWHGRCRNWRVACHLR